VAANPDDLQDFYGHDLGRTVALAAVAASVVSSGGTNDANGPLPPGKYLVQATSPGGTDLVFIDAVPFVKNETASWAAKPAAPPATPLIRGWVEIHVRKDHNDRIVARTTGGTATVYVTQVSRVPRKLPPA
jgi:hypothetical protein